MARRLMGLRVWYRIDGLVFLNEICASPREVPGLPAMQTVAEASLRQCLVNDKVTRRGIAKRSEAGRFHLVSRNLASPGFGEEDRIAHVTAAQFPCRAL